MRSFEKATNIKYKGIFISLRTLRNSSDKPLGIFGYIVLNHFISYATTSRALVQTADDDVHILFVVLISFAISA